MGRVEHTIEVAAPVEVAFEYVDDYRNVPKWFFGVSKFVPVGERDRGLGAVFDMAITLGPKTLHIRSEVVEYEENRIIASKSIRGLESTMTFGFEPESDKVAKLSAELTYKVPGGMAGRALGRILDFFISPGVRYTESQVRSRIEAFYSAGSGGR
jgi:uncharacterized membrane protein